MFVLGFDILKTALKWNVNIINIIIVYKSVIVNTFFQNDQNIIWDCVYNSFQPQNNVVLKQNSKKLKKS